VNYERNELISIAGEEFNGLGIVLEGNVAITKETVAQPSLWNVVVPEIIVKQC
jgi:hypothetical protein